ncbi:MAG: hypothetical protein CL677_04235 [Bdellovibrionaceae bacterium]|nr:hypothetical protein [Pseudobdellovibrionaceae bacterium]|tara:strand:- start:65432 stop:65686 length:255 start_codon:yes stop_codon:yes gene_type:complete
MEKGYNTDIDHSNGSYHVQTEDWGMDNPYLVSRVYQNGRVLKSLKIPYAEILPPSQRQSGQAVRLAMKIQHQKILDLLVSGQLL